MSVQNTPRRRLQVCGGYLLEFEQLARVLSFLQEHIELPKVSRDALIEGTGLANRQIESLVSVGAAMGLIRPGNQILTAAGRTIVKHDIFIEARGTLEWCHYMGAGGHRNLIWYEIFNTILPSEAPVPVDGWISFLAAALADQRTGRSLGKKLREEVRFVSDAYLNRNFKRLGILQEAGDGRLYRRRMTELNPKILAAMIYDFGARSGSELIQVDALFSQPGSPGMLFAMEKQTLREMAEVLHRNGWIRYEAPHNLDQIRLRPGFSPVDFLVAYYEDAEPTLGEMGQPS